MQAVLSTPRAKGTTGVIDDRAMASAANKAVSRTCRNCGKSFPSGNALHKHLPNCLAGRESRAS